MVVWLGNLTLCFFSLSWSGPYSSCRISKLKVGRFSSAVFVLLWFLYIFLCMGLQEPHKDRKGKPPEKLDTNFA